MGTSSSIDNIIYWLKLGGYVLIVTVDSTHSTYRNVFIWNIVQRFDIKHLVCMSFISFKSVKQIKYITFFERVGHYIIHVFVLKFIQNGS